MAHMPASESSPACLQVPDAKYMNVGSGTQLRQLLYAGVANSKSKQPASKAASKAAKGKAAAADDRLELERVFKVSCTAAVGQAIVPSVDRVISMASRYPNLFTGMSACQAS